MIVCATLKPNDGSETQYWILFRDTTTTNESAFYTTDKEEWSWFKTAIKGALSQAEELGSGVPESEVFKVLPDRNSALQMLSKKSAKKIAKKALPAKKGGSPLLEWSRIWSILRSLIDANSKQARLIASAAKDKISP